MYINIILPAKIQTISETSKEKEKVFSGNFLYLSNSLYLNRTKIVRNMLFQFYYIAMDDSPNSITVYLKVFVN